MLRITENNAKEAKDKNGFMLFVGLRRNFHTGFGEAQEVFSNLDHAYTLEINLR